MEPKLGFYFCDISGAFIEIEEVAEYRNTGKIHGIYPSIAAEWGTEIDIFGLNTLRETWPILSRDWTIFEEVLEQPPVNTSSVTDFDGNTYKTVKIGDQWWMAEI